MKITISGHRPDTFLQSHYPLGLAKEQISGVISGLYRQYNKGLMFNIGGALGADQWATQACIEQNIPFCLYLPFPFEKHTYYWEKDQKDELNYFLRRASQVHIISPEGSYNPQNYQVRNEAMVDNSMFLVAFWLGKRRGGTYNCMKYALEKSKFVANGFDDLRLLFSQDLEKGWTPPSAKVDK